MCLSFYSSTKLDTVLVSLVKISQNICFNIGNFTYWYHLKHRKINRKSIHITHRDYDKIKLAH